MGIKNLIRLIKRYSPQSIVYKKISDYKNKIIAFDGNLLLYKMIFAIRMNGYDIKNNDIIITHIHSTLLKIYGFNKYNITPVFVFDGIPPQIKNNILEQRKQFQNFMKQKYFKAVTQDEKNKYYFMKSDITLQEIEDFRELIKMFNYTVIDAIEEADAELAHLLIEKKVDYVATDDMDILIFGANKILKNFTIADNKKIQEVNIDQFKQDTKLIQSQLIDLAILLGCDYCSTIKGIGSVKAYKLIKEHGELKNMNISYDYDKAKEYFTNPPLLNLNNVKINKYKLNKNKLIEFLKKFDYDQKQINNILAKLL